MSDVVVQPGVVTRTRTFTTEVVAEMRRVTWPDRVQVRQLSLGVIVISLLVGFVILIMDLVLQGVLVKFLPSLFGG